MHAMRAIPAAYGLWSPVALPALAVLPRSAPVLVVNAPNAIKDPADLDWP